MSNIFLALQFWEYEVYVLFGEYPGTEGWEVGWGMGEYWESFVHCDWEG